MRKNYFRSLSAVALMLFGIEATAQTFTVDGIRYAVTSAEDMTCEVTDNGDRGYSGDIVIPGQVTADGVTYTVTAIGEQAFYNDGVRSVTLPNTVTEIKGNAFTLCTKLTSVELGDNLKRIGNLAFMSCQLASIELPPSLTTISTLAFGGNAFTSVVIPNSVTEMYDGAFMNCTSLKTVVIGNSLTAINGTTFNGCTALEDVTVGSAVTEMNTAAFQSCSSLKTMTMLCITPPTLNPTPVPIFNNVPIGNATLRVPAGTLAAYQGAPTWGDFGTIVEFTPTGITGVEAGAGFTVKPVGGAVAVEGVEGEVHVYDMSGAQVGTAKANGSVTIPVPAHGTYIIKVGSRAVKVAM